MTEFESSKSPQEETTRRAVSVVQAVTLIAILFTALGIYLAIQTRGAWQAYQFIILAAQVIVTSFVSASLIRRGRLRLGSWIIFTSNLIAPIWASLLVSRLGYVALAYILVTTYFTIRYVMPKEAQRTTIAATAFGLVITILVELIDPTWRLESSLMLTVSPILTGILGTIFIVIIARQAWAGSLRNKLLVAFIGVTVVATGALGSFTFITTSNNLRENLGRELSAQATDRATRIGSLLNEQINALTTLALNEVLLQAVETQNNSYEGSAATIQATLDAKDAQWRAADAADNNNDPLVRQHLNNAISREVTQYRQTFPDNVEVFVTDVHGGLVGSTNRTSDYYQADEGWWQAAYDNGQGGVFISEPEFDESAGAVSVLIALPIRDGSTDEIAGILRTTYIISPLSAILSEKTGQTGEADLFFPGEVVSHIHAGNFEQVEATEFEALQAVAGQGMVEMDYEGEPSVVTQAQVQSLVGNPFVDSLGWVVVFHQHRNEAFAPVNGQVRGLVIVLTTVVALAAAAAYFLSLLLVRPIIRLTATAEKVSAGDLGSRAEVATSDEIGTLATAFNNMTSQLQETLQGLEQRVAERTQNLELAADVGRSVSQVRDLNVMLHDACEMIRNEFDLYYVQVYLTNPSQMTLQLQAGTGTVGTQLLERRHRLQLNTGSINGRAVVEKRTVVISDTAGDATFHPNALLPDTRGEMAVPLIVNDKVVGVLDMQSSEPGVLNEEVLPAFEALAGQLAVAIQNATLLEEAKQARAEVEAQARRQIRANWAEYLDAVHKPEQIGFVFDRNEIAPLEEVDELPDETQAVSAPISLTGEEFGSLVVELDDEGKSEQTSELVDLVARQVAQQIENLRLLDSAERYRFEAEQVLRRQTRESWREFVTTRTGDSLGYLFDLKEVRPYSNGKDDASALNVPLKVRDETIGKLSIKGLESSDGESVEFASAVAERLSAHIESLRQYDQTQAALTQSEKLFEASRSLTQATDLQELVAATVKTLDIPVVNRAVLTVFDYDSADEIEQLTVVANWWNGEGHEITPVGTRYSLEVIQLMPMFVSPTPVFFDDAFADKRVDEKTMELVKGQNLRAVAVLPLHLGSQQVGALILEAEEPHNFTPQETRLFESLAPQIATVLENRQQYEKAQHQAEREAMLNAINQKIQSATSVEAVLQIAARELGHALGAPMTVAQLSMKDRN
jgi:GAF domain-containing protein/HAMP domain-containing protein